MKFLSCAKGVRFASSARFQTSTFVFRPEISAPVRDGDAGLSTLPASLIFGCFGEAALTHKTWHQMPWS